MFAVQAQPAPFCLLDEVDAPLDDANTERYANLVSNMSEQTQFLFISHNKIAMQMAKQLVGVTMQNRGFAYCCGRYRFGRANGLRSSINPIFRRAPADGAGLHE